VNVAVSEVSLDKQRLKLRVSPQTPLDPLKLMAWVRSQKGGQMSPDGTITIPTLGKDSGPIAHAQQVYRILSFIVLGALMIAASYVYHRIEKRLGEEAPHHSQE